jgi:hypothetical protein
MKVEELVELAKEVEISDPFDWADLSIDEESAYRLIALNIIDMKMDREIMLATIVKLCVENMVLNLRLLKQNKQSSEN